MDFNALQESAGAIDCFLGSLERKFRASGSPVTQEDLFAACKGFAIESIVDEYET